MMRSSMPFQLIEPVLTRETGLRGWGTRVPFQKIKDAPPGAIESEGTNANTL